MCSFATLLTKLMKERELSDQKLVDEITAILQKEKQNGQVPGSPRKFKNEMKDTITKTTIYNWKTGRVKRPECCLVRACGKALKLNPEQSDEFLAMARCGGPLPWFELNDLPCMPVVGTPVKHPYQFFGREELLGRIQWAWNKMVPEHIMVVGPRRSGKTSLLHYLKNISQATRLREGQPQGWPPGWCQSRLTRGFRFALIDFQEEITRSPNGFIKVVLQQLLHEEVPTPCDSDYFSQIVKQRLKQHQVVILMDEFNLGWHTLSEEFWQNLRSLGCSGNVSFVLASPGNFAELAQERGMSSPFFNIFGHTLTLECFTEKEARELIVCSPQPLQEVDWMLQKSHRWPALLQILCDVQLQSLQTGSPNWQEEGLRRIEGNKYYKHLLELPGEGK